MKILLLNQVFHPDPAATALYLTDLAVGLREQGHEVTVIASSRGYDDPSQRYCSREQWNGVTIIRIPSLGLGKTAAWRRALNFGSYLVACAVRLALLPRFDVVVALTTPPLISFLGALRRLILDRRFVFWVMDLNPDQAIAAGWLERGSLTARALNAILMFSLRAADHVVVLDRFMQSIITRKGIPANKLSVIPPWSHDDVHFDKEGREEFRREHGLVGKFVVMYAGNHSPCNPLDTLLGAARRLAGDADIVFCFVGGGSHFRTLERERMDDGTLAGIKCIPYQPRERVSALLSAADLHAVTLGDEFRGLIHPCKIYNILNVGAPVLYIGPRESHVTDLVGCDGVRGWHVPHGSIDLATAAVQEARTVALEAPRSACGGSSLSFSQVALLPQLIAITTAERPSVAPVEPLQALQDPSAPRL